MAVLIVLFGGWALFRALGSLGLAAFDTWHHSLPYARALMFVFTGVAHFNKTKYEQAAMVPGIFPHPLWIIYITGVLEFLGAVALLLPHVRFYAAICLMILLAAIFSANVKATLRRLTIRGQRATPLLPRTAMQILFLGLLWWSSRT